MLTRLRRKLRFSQLLPVAIQVCVLTGTHLDERAFRVGMWVVLVIAFFAWWRSFVRARAILDMPRARIASAAQGYTELFGRGRPLDGAPLLSPGSGLPVLWHRTDFYRRVDHTSMKAASPAHLFGQWERIETLESDASFLLDDDSGSCCAVDPEGAEMLIHRCDVYRNGEYRIEERCLRPNSPLYVLGEFATLGSISPEMDTRCQIKELLEQWKADKPGLLRRFDLDGDGSIDMQEWELARAEARRQILRRQQEVHAASEMHIMRKPHGRLYLISDLDPRILARRFQRWSIFYALSFVASAAAIAWQ